MRASNVEEISNPGTGDPWEVFTQLVIQIIEGRTPGGEKGFHAGPHCTLPQYAGINRHVCDPDSDVCFRFESLLRQLRLMWGVGVGVSVEVLVAPECEHGAAYTTALDNTTSAPSSQLRLIEQWSFIVFDRNMPEALISGWSLVAAVRSFLHFSQLSAWLSASGGSHPPNVLYRLTVTSPVFCSKFEAESEEHTFPIANIGQDTAIKVVVRSLPRSSRAPKVSCPEVHPKSEYHTLHPPSSISSLSLPSDHISSTPQPTPCPHSTATFSISSSSSTLGDFSSPTTHPPFSSFVPVTSSHSSASSASSASSSEFTFQGSGTSLKAEGNSKAEEDLRRSMMRARLGDPSRASRSESPDTQLGESLLDPPNSLSRIPRRFQSPSRSGSPSMETPEHIICRVRQPGPSHARPPDMPSFCQPLVVPARQPLNAFAWTQTRYPTPPQQQQHQQQYRSQHHSVHSNIFQASTLPTEPLPVAQQNDSYDAGRTSYSFTQSSNVPHNYYSSSSQNQLFWHARSSNIPSPIYDKEISSALEYPVMQIQPSARLEYKNCNSQVLSNREVNDQSIYDVGNEHLKIAAYNRQNEKYLEKFYKNSTSSNKIQVGNRCEELSQTTEPVTSNIFFGKAVGNHSTESRAFDQVSTSSGKEPQGTKRKGAYNRESPRTKRESPPHIYYSKEGNESEMTKEESREEERVKRKNSDDDDDDDGTERKVNSNKRGTASNKMMWSNCSDDRLWPSCSQPGKHLCSSVEDLLDITEDDDCSDFMPNSKSLKKKICCKFDGTSSSKISFDLTPKETEEVLNVLRQNNPLPPLRIYQSTTPASSKSTYIDANLKLKNRDRDGIEEKKCLGLIEKLDSFPEPRKTSSKISPYHKGEGSTGKARRCHRQDVSQTKTTVIKEDEKCAYPTSSNKCDTSFKKPINCSCDRKLNDSNIIKNTDINDSDDEVVDGLSPVEIHNLKQTKHLLPSNCVEAKKITHKTNYFTANSQPTLGTKDFLKQTSQALRKSPLTSVLSSIKKETRVTSVQDVPKIEEKTPERARRTLRFLNEENLSKSSKQERESTSALPERIQPPRILAIKERESKIFNETGNILKQLMKKNLSEENGYEKSLALETKKVTHEGIHETERNGNKRTILSLEEEEATSSNEEDREVEDLCKSKGVPIPTSSEKVKFRRSLDSAATLVFHNKTGLPLTSSPAPLRKGTCFDFDSSLNSIEGIRSAFRACEDVDEECDSICKDSSLGNRPSQSVISLSAPATVTCSNLLGSFEECVLNGRLEPVSTVQGFSAEIAASGAFCPKHTTKPVTVFFYTLCDNDQISSPYMGHINLGKKGYHVPNRGTVQVTLFNPHGTVVKMFVVVYDLSDMPPNSKTFLRQRTLNMPVGASDSHPDAHQWLRYLIHLRFASSKSNKIYLHTDIRMLIFRKSDADAATLHKTNVPYELRSFTHGPVNPKFSPRK